MGIYIAGKITGAHLNPAVTLALAVFRGFPWSKVMPYSLVQIAGAFVAAALVFWNYRPQFLTRRSRLWSAPPASSRHFRRFPTQPMAGLLDQTIGTALLLLHDFRDHR